ncbi:prophage tail fiber N-terminal domain-containing protein [Salmonella enterica subsp. enterica serovar Sandiego]|nr:prophage tail fiber N-terminal domain-containing protein [Salmonella enterica subsp. enterica serovar Sandiego]
MPVLISGVLKDGTGTPVQNCTIQLKACRTSTTVVVNTVASENPDDAGRYSMDVEQGQYTVTLLVEGYPPSHAGVITVYDDSKPGTLNDFLGAMTEDDVRPEALRRFEAMVEEVARQASEASRNATAAGQASEQAQTSAGQASESATAAVNAAGAAEASATQAASSAASAESSAGTATTKAGEASASAASADTARTAAAASAAAAKTSEANADASRTAAGESAARAEDAAKRAEDIADVISLEDASLTKKGIVQLSSATDIDSEALAATPKAVKAVMSEAQTKAPIDSPAFTGTPTTPTPPDDAKGLQTANAEFVRKLIAALVGSAPEVLDTLKELADALGSDPDFATTITNMIAGKQPLDNTLTNLSGKDVPALLQYLGLVEFIDNASNAVPSTRKVNGKSLSEDIDILASDVRTESGGGTVQSVIEDHQLRIAVCERNSRVENFHTLADTCTAELLSLNAPEVYDKSITLTVNEYLTTDYSGPVTGHCSIGNPQNYTLALYASTTLEYQSAAMVLNTDGTFSFKRSWPGVKSFKLFRTSNNGLVTVWEDPLCIRSYRMPSDAGDETVRVMKDRTYTYDQAVSAIALMAQGNSQVEQFVRGLCAIVGSGGSEGSVPFFVNRMSAQTSSQYYRTGNAAWVGYALAYYLQKYPDGEMAVVARDKLTQCAEWIEMFRVTDGSDVRSGLYTSGSGRYLDGVFYPDFDADWCTSEHQFDLWFLFDLMGRVGFTGYAEKAKALADAIIEKLWVEDEGRFYAGMRTTGVDKASPLDCSSWGGLFVANIDMEKARRCYACLERFWYATHDVTGYTPYHPNYGYPNKQRGVWVEGSAGVALLARRLGMDDTARDILARLAPLRTRYGYIDSCDYPDNDDMPAWPSSCNTAWMILACNPQGFWNVTSPAIPGSYYRY